MKYEEGQALVWQRANNFDPPERVTVVKVLSRGQARLSNGWTVDEDGIAEGTARNQGGSVRSP
jgi:hypothetical protein